MDRRKFLTLIPAAVTAVVIAPKLLIPKEGESVWSLKVQTDLKNRISTLRGHYIVGCDPVVSNRVYIHYVGKDGMELFHKEMQRVQMEYNMSWMRLNSYLK